MSNSCISHYSETTEANSMKPHRKIKHNEKVCRAQDLSFYTQGQGHCRVLGRIRVSAITQKLLKQIRMHNEKVCQAEDLGSYTQGKATTRSEFKLVSQP